MESPILIIVIFILVVAVVLHKKQGKYSDWYVKLRGAGFVMNILDEFKFAKNPKLKTGVTEKEVQNQLEDFLCSKFESVLKEYALEGANVQRIDFDIANGAVGIEVKLAEHVIKEAEWDRIIGQVSKYVKKKYGENKLIVLVVGSKKEENSTKIKQIKKDIEEYKAVFKYLSI